MLISLKNTCQCMDSVIDGFIGVLVNIEVAAKGAAFVRSGSTFADLTDNLT